jgi:hypothetical protein
MTVIALPTHGRWAWDTRGDGRAVRVATHASVGLLNVSLWRDDICVGTVRLGPEDAATLVAGLTEGLAELAAASSPAPPAADGDQLRELEERLARLERQRPPWRRAVDAAVSWAEKSPVRGRRG